MRFRVWLQWLYLLLTSIALSGAATADDIEVYTEEYPPYNYQDENDQVVGLATEKVRQVLDAAGFNYTIKVVPWRRAMHYATSKDNALIYTITRTPKRERKFDWLVPLADSSFFLFVRTEETRAVTPEALKRGDFSAACVSGDLSCDLISWTGIPEENITRVTNNFTGDFRMVIAGRADIYISDLAVDHRLRAQEGFGGDLTRPVMRLGNKAGFYLAAGVQVSEDIRRRVRAAYEALLAKKAYSRIDAAKLKPDS